MKLAKRLPANAVVLAFEGPDRYSMVGGLGVRVTQLTAALADEGVATDLFFVGDPELPPNETVARRVRLHRWSGWISRDHARGVYDNEGAKIEDFMRSVPPAVVSEIVGPANERGELTLVVGEDWQIAPTIVALHRELQRQGLRDAAVLMWNANNTYGFEQIDWSALAAAAQITAVSKYMKLELARIGIAAMVIPNGIPASLPDTFDKDDVDVLQSAMQGYFALLKVGRYDPDKRWLQAVDAVGILKDEGNAVRLIVRGGKEQYREIVMQRARDRGLTIVELALEECEPPQLATALERTRDADLLDLRSFVPDRTLYALYGAAEAVLANSGKEPFGLVGLEVMAMRGIPVCGSTGEEYARPFDNAIVCDTDDPRELAGYLRLLFADPRLARRIRKSAKQTAKTYTWPIVLETLAAKVQVLTSSSM
jgi:glycosyltransferase involved in cell wall biosynthesis